MNNPNPRWVISSQEQTPDQVEAMRQKLREGGYRITAIAGPPSVEPDDPTGLCGWWFRGALPEAGGRVSGKLVRYISAGDVSGFVIVLQHPETGILGEYTMVAVKDIWEQGWELFPPKHDGSCPIDD